VNLLISKSFSGGGTKEQRNCDGNKLCKLGCSIVMVVNYVKLVVTL
jgi:hypothetical protein